MLITVIAAPHAQAPQGRRGEQAGAPAAGHMQTIEERTAGFKKLDGYVPLYWDDKTGSLFLEINKFDTELLYWNGLSAGLGSNDIGLDRGQSGPGTGRQVPSRRPARADDRAELHLPRQQPEPGRAARRGGRVRDAPCSGASPSRPRPTPACWSTRPTSSCATRTTSFRACGRAATASTAPERDRHGLDQGVPEEHRDGRDADVHERGRAADGGGGGGGGPVQGPTPVGAPIPAGGGNGRGMFSGTVGQRHAVGRRRDAARAPHVRRAARRRLHAARRRSARRATSACSTSTTPRRSAADGASASSSAHRLRRRSTPPRA